MTWRLPFESSFMSVRTGRGLASIYKQSRVFAQVKERHMDGVCSVECYWGAITLIRFKHRYSVFFVDGNHLCRYQTLSAPLSDKDLLSDVSLAFLWPLKFPLSEIGFPRCCGFVWGFKRYEVRVKWYLWHLRGYFRLRGHSWTSTLPQISEKKASVCWFKVHLIRTRQNSTEFSNRELSWVQCDIFHLALIQLREDLINVWSQSWPGDTSDLSNNK